MKFSSEKTFLDIIEDCLERDGCKTWREVVPDQQKGEKNRSRVDLIFYRDDLGFIGIEGKKGNTLRQGKKFSDAIDQIKRYEKFTYLKGNFISRWCIAAPIKVIGEKEVEKEVTFFIRTFLRARYNIDLLEYHPRDKWHLDRCGIGILLPNSIYIGGENVYTGS